MVFETILIRDTDQVYDLLKSGEGDAYVFEGPEEAAFDNYGDITTFTFMPLIFSSVSLSTQKKELEPIISVMQKFLQNGGRRYLAELYNQGYDDYLKHKLFSRFTSEEIEYIQNNPLVPYVAEPDNYPISFYNFREKQWQGISVDILKVIEMLTGLQFEWLNDENTNWTQLLMLLENGEAAMVSELIRSEEREGRFLWPATPVLINNYALISKLELPYVHINQIFFNRVGLLKDTAHAQLFKDWFPEHPNLVEFDNADSAFMALERDEIEMVMARQSRLLDLTNYRELPGYKANFVFDLPVESTFGLNINEAVLCSIIDKAMQLVDAREISGQWMRRTYDYRAKVLQAQRPWLIGASVLSLIILVLVFVLFIKSHNIRKQLEKLVVIRTGELQIRTEEALAASYAKSIFLAKMSHEIRTPLNAVIGLTDLILEEGSLTNNVSENLHKIGKAGNNLLNIVNDILDFSKIETGSLALVPVEYSLAGLLNDVITLMNTRITEKPIVFGLNISENLPARLYGDDLRIKQILNNLLSNAFKYTEKGNIELSVNCSIGGEKDVWVDFAVNDTGIGISKENQDKLFTDYYQVEDHASRKVDGTGLGLSITKRLAEMMGGGVSIESELGKGSVFYVRIRQGYIDDTKIGPVIADNLRNFNYTEDNRIIRKKFIRPDLSYARALVVDDMKTNHDVASGLLGKYKMQIDCVLSGQEAIDLIRAEKTCYNIIFMDYMMPEMDGIETANKIRALGTEYARNIPIVALTANAVQGTEEMFYANDFQGFVSKPIDIMHLDSIIKKWVQHIEL